VEDKSSQSNLQDWLSFVRLVRFIKMGIFAQLILAMLATQSWAVPTLYLAGDSTMALGGGGTGTQG
jgi:hypothetical protein